ncbi:PorP/SprF family type IX secretion system membrane protein [Mucilaginibacter auburnensis]|uniref:Type IX secretion system PorP/SprF family membrane protein n=1 Tax=Mucilaginibacter auburnensis TaxID=1457233 RepID=A0A2H9VLF0_9SPHI|nr:PorP/SprF family type IX secretion system membrane protein [Mucilaginibacter auburnensis]PJJ79153.1 type IX secretion system PorP/SprF family membrane protein [Mucilaginibacter auburnensis]
MKKLCIKLTFCLIAILLYILPASAQDPYFTQYFASPLSLNPANTGLFDGDYRVAVNQRVQWWNVGSSYHTTSISFDAKLFQEQMPDFDIFGIGFSGIFDKSLNGALESTFLSASGAYHKSLASDGRHILTVGMQATYANRFINYNQLTFASQFNVDFFDRSLPNYVDTRYSATSYLEANAGLIYSYHVEKANLYIGTSLYHATRPTEQLFNETGYKVPFRTTIHMGGEVYVNDQSSVLFSGVYAEQQNITDKIFGVAYGISTAQPYFNSTEPRVKFYLGLWHRLGQSFIPYVGVDYNNYGVGLNYSFTSSQLSNYRPQTFEISFIYRKRANKSSLCPRF